MKKQPFLLGVLLILVSCGGGEQVTPSDTISANSNLPSSPVPVTCKVSFDSNGGSSVSGKTVNSGESISAPTSPTKSQYLFDGWFTDKALTQEAFFPYKVTSDTIFYAGWLSCKDYFFEARKRTVDGAGWSYTDNLSITTKLSLSGVYVDGPTAKRQGETKYSSTGDVGFYQHFTSSGALFYDGQTHSMRKGTTLQTIKQNEDGEVTSVEEEAVASDYKYDTSTYAKAIFEYDEEDIKSVTAVSGYKNKFLLKTKANASSVMKSLIGNADNAAIKAMVSAMENVDTSSDFDMYVTFTDDKKIDTYEYDFGMDLTVSGNPETINISYKLDFDGYSASKISLPTFEGVSIDPDEIQKDLSAASGIIDTYKGLARSAYDYEVHADVKGLTDDFSITVKGDTKRVFKDGVNYFDNLVKMDQAKYDDEDGKEYADYDAVRGVLSTGEVYDIHDKLGFTNPSEKVTSTDISLDYFYFLPQSSLFDKKYFISAETTTKNNDVTYTLFLNKSGAVEFMNFISDSIRLQPLNSKNVKVFGEFNESSIFALDDIRFEVSKNASGFSKLSVKLTGTYQTTIQNQTGTASFSTTLSITPTDDAKSYEPPSEAKKFL